MQNGGTCVPLPIKKENYRKGSLKLLSEGKWELGKWHAEKRYEGALAGIEK